MAGTKKVAKKKSSLDVLADKWDNTNRWLKRIVEICGSLVAIGGVFAGIMGAFVGQVDGYLDQKLEGIQHEISELRSESEAGDKKLEVSNTRVELMMLMSTDPTNVVAIERMARYYFVTLEGDQYMSAMYSDWARAYGGDTSFVLK